MKYSKFFIPTLREAPGDALVSSHILMLRSAMIRKLSNGLFAYLPLGLRSFRKLENIIRQEMNAIGSLEIKPTVVVPGELWKESGRWDSMGPGLLRLKNRLNADFVVSPTAEEAFTALIRDELSSYKQLPLSLYQINTKYRDEIRPRYGVMRGREFVMKDAYSFHTDDASLDDTYRDMDTAYRRIFKRCGLSVIAVKADSGTMGGSGSQEFMVESDIGDNTLILCRSCDYAANVEKAACKPDYAGEVSPSLQPQSLQVESASSATPSKLEKIDTPNVKTIEELTDFLKVSPKTFIKTLIYKAVNVELDLSDAPCSAKLEKTKLAPGAPLTYTEVFVAVLIRGDLDVNETKLAAVLKAGEVILADHADDERITGAPVGFAGPVGLKNVPIFADESVSVLFDAVTGALEKDKHFKHVAFGRDFTPYKTCDLRTVKAGDKCPVCGGELYEKKGNELGHIFKLGYKYTKSMNVNYLDINGKAQTPVMGSYGIGLDRTLAGVIEEHHDEAGIIWPMSLAPFHVEIVPIKYGGEVQKVCDTLAAELERNGVEVLLDDRPERPGVKFNDSDLIGIPFRVVVGDKNLAQSPPMVELKKRGAESAQTIALSDITNKLIGLIDDAIMAL